MKPQSEETHGDRDRAAHAAEAGRADERRSWLDRTSDEISSWFGDENALGRRRQDAARGDHSGKGPAEIPNDDARILSEVTLALTADAALDASRMLVGVTNGSVALTGAVSTSAGKRRAESVASGVTGVRLVRNDLTVE